MDYQSALDFAKQLAEKAGVIMKQYDKQGFVVETKSDDSPVTIADKEINDLVLNEVAAEYPDHGVLGEEASDYNGQKLVWVCDPIDGTIAYINHIPTSVFSIALVEDGDPVVSVIYNPWTDELYYASKGEGAYCNSQRLNVSDKSMKGATVGASGNMSSKKAAMKNVDFVSSVEGTAYVVNTVGTIFKGYLVAAGRIEGHIFPHKTPHDVASVKLLVEEAGGKVTDLDGNDQRYDQPINGAVISNGIIHTELLGLV